VQRYGLIWTSIHGRDITQANIPVLDTWDDAEHQAILPPFVDIGGSEYAQPDTNGSIKFPNLLHQNCCYTAWQAALELE